MKRIVARLPKLIILATVAVLSVPPSVPIFAEEQSGITHTALLKSPLPGTPNLEVIVWDTVYAPGSINPRLRVYDQIAEARPAEIYRPHSI